jgi:hypothetical protein
MPNIPVETGKAPVILLVSGVLVGDGKAELSGKRAVLAQNRVSTISWARRRGWPLYMVVFCLY